MTENTPIRAICEQYGLTQAALAKRFGIPLRTVEQWCTGRRQAPPYVVAMIEQILEREKELDFAACELAQYRAAYGCSEPKIIPNNRPIGRWIEVKTLVHAAEDGSAFCYQLQHKCPECGVLEDKVRKHCPECGADMGLKEG